METGVPDTYTQVKFFMGANTPSGFTAYLDDLYEKNGEWRVFLIKSGPGTGKASLMRKVRDHMLAKGIDGISILCSSDPDSLDGLIFPSIKACILDATAPHVIEPSYWGAVERIVDLSAFVDIDTLRENASEIIAATNANTALHVRTRKFIGAAASLLSDTCRMAMEHTDTDKIIRAASRLAVREFPQIPGKKGKSTRYFLSAVTPKGLITLHESIQVLCPRIYSVEDEYGASSRLLLGELCRYAQEAGYDVISCADPLFPADGPEHLLVPSAGIGFTTSNQWHKADFPVYRRIHAVRFTDSEALRSRRPLISFNRRAVRELIGEAVSLAQEAKAAHDRMEQYYTARMDWEGVNRLSEKVLAEFDRITDAPRS